MSDVAPIALLRQAVQAAEQGAPIPPEAAEWLTAGIPKWEAAARAGDPISLDVALGLATPGQRGWVYQEAKANRDMLLRELHKRVCPHLERRDAARAVVALLRRHMVATNGDSLIAATLAAGAGTLKVTQMARILSVP